jgi:hypothetical protein
MHPLIFPFVGFIVDIGRQTMRLESQKKMKAPMKTAFLIFKPSMKKMTSLAAITKIFLKASVIVFHSVISMMVTDLWLALFLTYSFLVKATIVPLAL